MQILLNDEYDLLNIKTELLSYEQLMFNINIAHFIFGIRLRTLLHNFY